MKSVPRGRWQSSRHELPRARVRQSRTSCDRRGAALVELAVLLPLLAFLFVIAVDFARIYHYSLTLQNCARAGAMYASDPNVADESPFASIPEAALADAVDLDPQPTITNGTGTDASGRTYVAVAASYPYRSLTHFPGIPHTIDVVKSERMYTAAVSPNFE